MKLRKMKDGEKLEVGTWYAYSDRDDGVYKISKRLHSSRVVNSAYSEHFEVLDFSPDDIEILPEPQPGELWKWRYDSQIIVAHIAGDKLATANGLEFAANDGKWKPLRRLWVRPEGWEK